MSTFNIPKKEEVSVANQAIFNDLEKQMGFVPNLKAAYAYSENAQKNFMVFSGAPSYHKAKEKEVVNLAVNQINIASIVLQHILRLAK